MNYIMFSRSSNNQYQCKQNCGLRMRFLEEVLIISLFSLRADNFCSGQICVVFCETGMSSHLMIVQGPNLTENYQSTNQDKNYKILSSNYVDSDNKCYVMSWIGDLVPELFTKQVLNGSLEKRSTFILSNTLYTKHLI